MGIGKLMNKFKTTIGSDKGRKKKDDFDWNTYHINYVRDIRFIEKDHTQTIKKGDLSFADGVLVKVNAGIKPLHPNYRLLYETILQLNPKSIFEMGCGGGDHLHNINVLRSDIELTGVDISEGQISFLRERHPNLKADISVYNCTLPLPFDFKQVDIAYTQAVIMHIQEGNGHLVALSNLFKVARNQVVLMENWGRHDFMSDIRMLKDKKIIPWEDLFFYYRISEELQKPHIMVVSSRPVSGYVPLEDYAVLKNG